MILGHFSQLLAKAIYLNVYKVSSKPPGDKTDDLYWWVNIMQYWHIYTETNEGHEGGCSVVEGTSPNLIRERNGSER